ncbi:MAG TPA: HAD-IA family hydrolase [Gaiellaceae bacterium]|nr:HAD-IA family hydrolase [Gaiellaceae bacterium]
MADERWVTFDVYGTMIDWMAGIRTELARLWPDEDADRLLERYHELEPQVEEGRAIPYRDVLAETLARLAAEEGLSVPPGEEGALGDSLPSWRPFPEVPGALAELRGRGFRLAPLSNTDPEFLAASFERIGVPIDGQITASDAGSYKPAHGHWERFFERYGADRDRHVHVAASLFHDIEPAEELGLKAVWINRLAETSDLPRAAELKDLSRLPDVLDELVPATF